MRGHSQRNKPVALNTDANEKGQSKNRPSGWILPDATWHPCEPWNHVKTAKEIPFILELKSSHWRLSQCWELEDDEPIRDCFARMGLIKICYNLIDANEISQNQLKVMQDLFRMHQPETDLEFIGGIRLKLELRLFLKLKSPERLNLIASMS